MNTWRTLTITVLLLFLVTSLALARDLGTAVASTGFTYQGQLKVSGVPYTGQCDFEFALYETADSTITLSGPQTRLNVPVSDGLFTVLLDFGSDVFNGAERYLQISVGCPAGTGIYTDLTPRQALTPTPYAIYSTMNWSLTGNSGTTPGTNYLGTSDDTPIELKVNAQRALRLEPQFFSPNLIGGYPGNWLTSGVYGATIGGGGNSEGFNRVTDSYGTISGGRNNQAGDNAGIPTDKQASTVGGGAVNTASGPGSVISGGFYNTASGDYSTISGGYGNIASGYLSYAGGGVGNLVSNSYAAVSGGSDNIASGRFSFVGGGQANTASGEYTTIPGGRNNTALGSTSFAAGYNAAANNPGCFVWADSTGAQLTCANDNRYIARASGGIYFYSNSTSTSGIRLEAGSNAWSVLSDRNMKENLAVVDARSVLERLSQVPVTTWNYTTQDGSIRHIGPMAQDFYAAFGVGESETHITTIDADGVALAAIQGLYAENQELKAQVDALEDRLSALERSSQSGASSNTAGLPISWLLVVGVAAAGGAWFLRRRSGNAS